MAIIYSYPLATPKLDDLLIGTSTYDENATVPVYGNPTVSFTLRDVVGMIAPVIGLQDLQSVTTVGNTTSNSVVINNSLSVLTTIKDSSGNVGSAGQLLSSTVTGTSWITNSVSGNYFVTAAAFDTATGILSITGNNAAVGATVDLDGRYLTGSQTITGNKEFAPSSTSTSYTNAAVELRESNYSGSSGAPPRISWHWGGVVASSMTIESNGTIAVRNNPGNAYEQFACGNLKAHGGTFVLGSGGNSDMYIGNYSTNKYFRFHTNNSETFFGMNCGTVRWREGSSTRYYFYPSTANMTINGTLTQNSDSRVKENVVEIDNCISKVQAMRGVYYNRTDFNTEVTKVGVIAQEVEAVLPELILEASDTGLKSVAYAELTAVLINAIKEQQEIIEDLKTRITKLEK